MQVYTSTDENHKMDVEMSVAYTDGDSDCPAECDGNTPGKEQPMCF